VPAPEQSVTLPCDCNDSIEIKLIEGQELTLFLPKIEGRELALFLPLTEHQMNPAAIWTMTSTGLAAPAEAASPVDVIVQMAAGFI